MSQEKEAERQVEDMQRSTKQPIELRDLCTQVVFALDIETFLATPQFEFPSVICNCIVENVIVTSRNAFFNCNSVLLCIEFNICIKFFPKVGTPFCQSFQACFTKFIPIEEFKDFTTGCPITLEEFQTAEGACVVATPLWFDCLVENEVCETEITVPILFGIAVKLFRERNVVVLAVPFFLEDFPTEMVPKVVNGCGLPNLAVEHNCGACGGEHLAKVSEARKEQIEKVMAEKKHEFEKKFKEMKKVMGKLQ